MPMELLSLDGGYKMSRMLLTNVAVNLVNKYVASQEYGVSLINIPDFDYGAFSSKLIDKKQIAIFFLGFSKEAAEQLQATLPSLENVQYSFSVRRPRNPEIPVTKQSFVF